MVVGFRAIILIIIFGVIVIVDIIVIIDIITFLFIFLSGGHGKHSCALDLLPQVFPRLTIGVLRLTIT